MRLYDTARREVVPVRARRRSSRCTRAASRRTTPPTSATPPPTSPTTSSSAGCATVGHDTRCVRNITDVDDDLLRKARELGVHYLDLAAAETARFDDDMEALELLADAGASPGPPRPSPTSAASSAWCSTGATPTQAGGAVYFDVELASTGSVRSATSTATRCSSWPRERGGNPDDPNKRDPLDFVLWQPSRRRRAGVGVAVGPGPPGLAHRVLGAGPARARHHHRPARRRHRPDLPAPRVRGGPVRGGHRRAVRAPLDAPGDGAHGRREDVEVARQPRVRQRPAARTCDPRAIRLAVVAHHYRDVVGVGRRR